MPSDLLISRVFAEYQSAHSDFVEKRGAAVLYSSLLAVGALPLCILAVFQGLGLLLGATPIILAVGVSAFWGFARAAKVRLETIKRIVEQENYVIGRTVEDGTVQILAADERVDMRIFDDAFINSLKISEGQSSTLPPQLFLAAPRGRVTKYYVRLFTT